MHRLMAELVYRTGVRVMECCTLRVRDLVRLRKELGRRPALAEAFGEAFDAGGDA